MGYCHKAKTLRYHRKGWVGRTSQRISPGFLSVGTLRGPDLKRVPSEKNKLFSYSVMKEVPEGIFILGICSHSWESWASLACPFWDGLATVLLPLNSHNQSANKGLHLEQPKQGRSRKECSGVSIHCTPWLAQNQKRLFKGIVLTVSAAPVDTLIQMWDLNLTL